MLPDNQLCERRGRHGAAAVLVVDLDGVARVGAVEVCLAAVDPYGGVLQEAECILADGLLVDGAVVVHAGRHVDYAPVELPLLLAVVVDAHERVARDFVDCARSRQEAQGQRPDCVSRLDEGCLGKVLPEALGPVEGDP